MKLSKELEDKINIAIEQSLTDENHAIAGMLYTVLAAGISNHEEDLEFLVEVMLMANLGLIAKNEQRIKQSKIQSN